METQRSPEEFERARLLFGRVMRLEYKHIVVDFIRLVNDGQSWGFNVQERFDPLGTTRKFKMCQYLLNTFGSDKVERALDEFARQYPTRVNPKRRGKRSWAGTTRPEHNTAQEVEVTDNVPVPAPEEAAPNVAAIVQEVMAQPEPIIVEGLQHKSFPDLVRLVTMRDGNGYTYPVWIPGPAGSGKTTAAMNAAKHISLAFYHTGAVGNQYELLGFRDGAGHVADTAFKIAYRDGGIFLWDEVDASNPAALVCFNAALENGHCAFPDGSIERHKDFIPIAAANTYGAGATHEYVGRNKLDAATVDRFIMLEWDYDEALERAITGNDAWCSIVQRLRKAVMDCGIKHVVSPRASVRGARMMRAGFTQEQALAMTVRKGLSVDQWRQVKARAGI